MSAAPKFDVKVTSFNILGLGFCALPGSDTQWTHFKDLLDELLAKRNPGANEISFVGLQEDVFILKEGAEWEDHTTDKTHANFERISFGHLEFAKHGFEMVSMGVHDGLSNSSQMVVKDPAGQLEALTDARHRGLLTETSGTKKTTKPKVLKLGNSIWVKKGAGLETVSLRGETVTFDTWVEGDKRNLPEYHMVPSRSAAKAVASVNGKDVFAAMTFHLAGGKFDDRWLLTGDSLTSISQQMLQSFGNSAGDVPKVVFGDTNMKHHEWVDSGMYDDVIRGMLFGTKDAAQITKLSPGYEGHRKYLLRIGDEIVTDEEVASLAKSGKKLEELASVYEIENANPEVRKANSDTLFRRAKELWKLEDVPGMALLRPGKDANSCLFGGVVDQIFHSNTLKLKPGSHVIDENPKAMLPANAPGIKGIFDRIIGSDHFPVTADFAIE